MDTERANKLSELSAKIIQVLVDNDPDFPTGMGALCMALGQAAHTWGADEEEAMDAVRKYMKHIYSNNEETLQ